MKYIMFSARAAHQPGNWGWGGGGAEWSIDWILQMMARYVSCAFRVEITELSNIRREWGMMLTEWLGSVSWLWIPTFIDINQVSWASYLTSMCFYFFILRTLLVVSAMPRGQWYYQFLCTLPKIFYAFNSLCMCSFSFFPFYKNWSTFLYPFLIKLTAFSWRSSPASHKEPLQLY